EGVLRAVARVIRDFAPADGGGPVVFDAPAAEVLVGPAHGRVAANDGERQLQGALVEDSPAEAGHLATRDFQPRKGDISPGSDVEDSAQATSIDDGAASAATANRQVLADQQFSFLQVNRLAGQCLGKD